LARLSKSRVLLGRTSEAAGGMNTLPGRDGIARKTINKSPPGLAEIPPFRGHYTGAFQRHHE